MANVRNGNTFFIDTAASDHLAATTGNLAVRNIRVTYITLTGVGGAAILDLKDVTSDSMKIHLEAADSTTEYFDFSEAPIVFPNGIHPETVTQCEATLVVRESQG